MRNYLMWFFGVIIAHVFAMADAFSEKAVLPKNPAPALRHNSITSTIGATPLVKLNRLAPEASAHAPFVAAPHARPLISHLDHGKHGEHLLACALKASRERARFSPPLQTVPLEHPSSMRKLSSPMAGRQRVREVRGVQSDGLSEGPPRPRRDRVRGATGLAQARPDRHRGHLR